MPKPADLPPGAVTELLKKAQECHVARDELFAITYDKLKQIAGAQIRRYKAHGRRGETSLVQDAVLKVLRHHKLEGAEDRERFFTVVRRAMRDVLRDFFRSSDAAKNGGGCRHAVLIELQDESGNCDVTPEELSEAIEALAVHEPSAASAYVLVKLYGETLRGAADVLGRSLAQVRGDCAYAGPWLHRYLNRRLR